MGEPKVTKKSDPVQEGIDQCNLQYKDEPEKARACKQYVMNCGVHAGKDYVDEFKLCSAKGQCLKIKNMNQCLDTAIFMSGMIDQYGPFGKITLKKKAPPTPEVKPDTIHRAGDDAYEKLGLDRNRCTIYYVDGGEDIVFVDRIGVEKEPGFSTKHPDDQMRKISLGKEGKPIDPNGTEVAALLAKWRIPTVDNIDIEKLIAFNEVIEKNSASIKKAIEGNSVETEQVARDYIEIMDAAEAVYLGAAILDDAAVMDLSWNGSIAKAVMAGLGENAYVLPLYVAKSWADRGNVGPMDDAVAKLKSMGDIVKADSIAMIRRIGYSAAIKKALTGLEALAREGKATITELKTGAKGIDVLMEGHARADAKAEPLSWEEDVVFEDSVIGADGTNKVHVDDVKARIDALRVAACVIKAQEILNDAWKNKLQGKPLERKFKEIRELPVLMGVSNIAGGLEAVNKEIADFVAGNSRKKVDEYIGKARTEYETFTSDNTENIEARKKLTADPQWLKAIDGWLNMAIDEASAGGILPDVQAEIHKLRRSAYETYTKAWIDRLNTSVSGSTTAAGEAWYNDVKKSVADIRAVLKDAALKKADGSSDEETRANLLSQIDAVEKAAHIARIEQLIRSAINEKDACLQRTQPNWGVFLGIIKEARKVIADNGISDTGLTSRLSQLEASMKDYDLETVYGKAKQLVDNLDVSRYQYMNLQSIDANADLSNIDRELDAVIEAAKRADEEAAYAPKVRELRKNAYERYFKKHLDLATYSPGAGGEGWFDDTMMQARLAGMYLDAQRGGDYIFDPTFRTQKAKEIEILKGNAHEKMAVGIQVEAARLFESEAAIRRNARYLEQLNATLDKARAHMREAGLEDGVNQIETTRREGYVRYIALLVQKAEEEMAERLPGWKVRAMRHVDEGIRILKAEKISGTDDLVFKTIPIADIVGKAEKGVTWLDKFQELKTMIEKEEPKKEEPKKERPGAEPPVDVELPVLDPKIDPLPEDEPAAPAEPAKEEGK